MVVVVAEGTLMQHERRVRQHEHELGRLGELLSR
jgi:hypothetical protein